MWFFDMFTYEYEFWYKFKDILDWAWIKNYFIPLNNTDYTNIIKYIEKKHNRKNDKCINSIYLIITSYIEHKSNNITLWDKLIDIYFENAYMNWIKLNLNMNSELKILEKIFNQ